MILLEHKRNSSKTGHTLVTVKNKTNKLNVENIDSCIVKKLQKE